MHGALSILKLTAAVCARCEFLFMIASQTSACLLEVTFFFYYDNNDDNKELMMIMIKKMEEDNYNGWVNNVQIIMME